MTLWNKVIPVALRGRLAGIEMISYMSGPMIGNFQSGFFGAFIGNAPAIALGSVLCMLGVMACTWRLPAFWRFVDEDPK
jgi:hypothetical protein